MANHGPIVGLERFEADLSDVRERIGRLEAAEQTRAVHLWPQISELPGRISHLEKHLEAKIDRMKPGSGLYIGLATILIALSTAAGAAATQVFQSREEGARTEERVDATQVSVEKVRARAAEDRKAIQANTQAIQTVNENVVTLGEALKIGKRMKRLTK